MSVKRFARAQRAVALVPLAMLSVAATASVAGFGVSSAVATAEPRATLPDGTSLPTQAIEAPASVSSPDSVAPAIGDQKSSRIVATSSTSGIPSAALAAYQRAETVINAADKSCHLSWQLIAAIGRVESNHGRYDGNVLNDEGVATPGIYGPALNGKHSTTLISDTDAGQYDNDTTYDRAVGPMQFIPATWSVVGVDADGDAKRDPQDIDDAALGTAVYLCSGEDDLSSTQGQRASVYRYNHSQSYVDLVLSIMNAYLDGDFTSMPNNTAAAGQLVPVPAPVHQGSGHGDGNGHGNGHNPQTGGGTSTPTEPTTTPTPDPGGGGSGTAAAMAEAAEVAEVAEVAAPPNVPPVTLPPIPTTSIPPVDAVLNLADATAQCLLDGVSQLTVKAFADCLDSYMNP